ncbi:MAG: nucleotidyltransferase family protein [Truepera sp.]|nr:nucleotidyltransferase family protein [Truepera sp.]
MPLPPYNQERLTAICERFHVRRLAVFGSYLHREADAASDLDLLVEFAPGQAPGLGFVRLQSELEKLFGCRVDLHTPRSLSRYFRQQVLAEAQVLHAAA